MTWSGYVIGGTGVFGVGLLLEATREWSPSDRLLILATSASLLFVGMRLTFLGSGKGAWLRSGEAVPGSDLARDGSSTPPYVAGHERRRRSGDRVRFGIKPNNSLIALGVMAPAAALAILFGLDGLEGDKLSSVTLAAIFVLGPAVFVSARSLMRVVFARSAITATADQLKLGVALGYIPPLTIDRPRLTQIRQLPSLGLVVDHKRVHELCDSHLQDRDGLFDWITTNWPEATVLPVSYELGIDHPTVINESYDEAYDSQMLAGTYQSRPAALDAARRYVDEHADSLKPDAFVWILATEGSFVVSLGGVFPDGTEGD